MKLESFVQKVVSEKTCAHHVRKPYKSGGEMWREEMKAPEFLKNQKEELSDTSLTELKKLVDKFLWWEQEVKDAEEKLKEKKKEFNHLSLDLIPEFLLATGLSEIKLASGEKVVIKEGISVTIKDEEAFYKFLEDRNELDILKTQFDFGHIEDEQLENLFAWLMHHEYEYEVKKDVHAQTKAKYFRDLLGIGVKDYEEGLKRGRYLRKEDIEIFASIFTFHITKVK